MAEDLQLISGSKEEIYQSLVPQINALLEGEPDLIANLANTAAALKEQFNWLWDPLPAQELKKAGAFAVLPGNSNKL
jgi:putative methionine-R-sulfoxide reductase with GAF domain